MRTAVDCGSRVLSGLLGPSRTQGDEAEIHRGFRRGQRVALGLLAGQRNTTGSAGVRFFGRPSAQCGPVVEKSGWSSRTGPVGVQTDREAWKGPTDGRILWPTIERTTQAQKIGADGGRVDEGNMRSDQFRDRTGLFDFPDVRQCKRQPGAVSGSGAAGFQRNGIQTVAEQSDGLRRGTEVVHAPAA